MSSETVLKPYDKDAFQNNPWSRAGKGFCSQATCVNDPTFMVVQIGEDTDKVRAVRAYCEPHKERWEQRKQAEAMKEPLPHRMPSKALQYIAEGRLTVAARSVDSALVLVQGSALEPYRTTFAGNHWQCTCKAAVNGLGCSHVQAARALTGLVEEKSLSLGNLPAPAKPGGIDTGAFWEQEDRG